ncbi:MAG: FAD:protein FMN transferase [Armatimonadetes bacterium]|nr:FAD:protein FMN transferase [Armatimonadota bacterium]
MADPVSLSTYAMATRFEVALYGEDPARLRAAGEEALAEIERLDRQLSFYDPASDISAINRLACREPLRVEPMLFALLEQAAELHSLTEGAFDITIAPLMQVWGLAEGPGRLPGEDEIADALALVGMRRLHLDPAQRAVFLDRPGVRIDLGAIGKGYAVEQAACLLRECGVASALLHGGTSTIAAVGSPPGQDAWQIGIRSPGSENLRETVSLSDNALSVSAVHGKSFTVDGREYGHLLDPRTGYPVSHTRQAAVSGPSPIITDALSTALLVLGQTWIPLLEERFPGYRGSAIGA